MGDPLLPGRNRRPGSGQVGIWFYDEEDEFVEEESYKQDLRAYRLDGGDYMIPPHGTLMTGVPFV